MDNLDIKQISKNPITFEIVKQLNEQTTLVMVSAFVRGIISTLEFIQGKIEQEKGFTFKCSVDEKGTCVVFEWNAGQYDDTEEFNPTLQRESKYEEIKERIYFPLDADFDSFTKKVSNIFDLAFEGEYFTKSLRDLN